MNEKMILIIAAGVCILVVIAIITKLLFRRKKRKNFPDVVKKRWLEIQRLCASKESWGLAVTNADALLGEALKSRRYKGKSIGERLVAAQRKLSDNDAVWYAHNLAKKISGDQAKRLREADVKKALIGFRQALRDIGAMNGK